MAKLQKSKTAIIVGNATSTADLRSLVFANSFPGAGAGGIATAARLAKAGFETTVIEKNDYTGGRCSLLHHEGHVRLLLFPCCIQSLT